RAFGTTKIRATNALNTAIRDSLSVSVTNAPATIALSRALDTLATLNSSITYTATVKNARTDAIALTSLTFTWTSRAPSVASVNTSTGVATSAGVGSTYIVGTACLPSVSTASCLPGSTGSVSDSAKIVVSNHASTLTVAPSPANLTSIGATQTLTATARNASNNVVTAANLAATGDTVVFVSNNAAI